MLPEVQLDPLALERGRERLAKRGRLTREQPLGALDDRDRRAHACDRLGELDADRPAAEHEQPPRDLGQAGRLAVGPHTLELTQPRHGRDHGIRAGGEHDVSSRVDLVADQHSPRPIEPSGAAQHLNARARSPARLAGVVVPADHEVPPRERGGSVDQRRGQTP